MIIAPDSKTPQGASEKVNAHRSPSFANYDPTSTSAPIIIPRVVTNSIVFIYRPPALAHERSDQVDHDKIYDKGDETRSREFRRRTLPTLIRESLLHKCTCMCPA